MGFQYSLVGKEITMYGELLREAYELQENEKKADVLDRVLVVLDNAIGYMLEDNMSREEVAEYLGIDVEALGAIEDEDIDVLSEKL